jgi:hypothetical protein
MKRAELIRHRRTQSLASEIQRLLNRQIDIERQEIHQVVVDILHLAREILFRTSH